MRLITKVKLDQSQPPYSGDIFMLEYILALAIAIWGIVPPLPISVEFYDNPQAPNAQAGCVETECFIGIQQSWWDAASDDYRLGTMLHEVGHTYGLNHYGSCNYNLSVMGCPAIPYVTDYDRVELAVSQGTAYSLIVDVSYDGQ